jgi:hypothetical protein
LGADGGEKRAQDLIIGHADKKYEEETRNNPEFFPSAR